MHKPLPFVPSDEGLTTQQAFGIGVKYLHEAITDAELDGRDISDVARADFMQLDNKKALLNAYSVLMTVSESANRVAEVAKIVATEKGFGPSTDTKMASGALADIMLLSMLLGGGPMGPISKPKFTKEGPPLNLDPSDEIKKLLGDETTDRDELDELEG